MGFIERNIHGFGWEDNGHILKALFGVWEYPLRSLIGILVFSLCITKSLVVFF